MNDREGQKTKLHEIASAVRGQLGKESVVTFEDGIWDPVEAISTGSVALDRALGVGGFPRGRIVELLGSESSGKSSICLSTIVQAQRQGLICAYIDAENAFNPTWAGLLGVDVSFLLMSQENCTENVFALVDKFIEQGVNVIVIDSVAGLAPKAEIEGDVGDFTVGLRARLMSQALSRLASKLNKINTLMIFINQIRMQIGVMFGNPETTPGGKALKFYSSVRLDVRDGGKIKEGEDIIGIKIRINVVKNKVASPFKKAEADFYFDRGFDNELAYFDVAAELGIFRKNGAYFEFEGENKHRAEWCTIIKEDPSVLKRVVGAINGV